MVRIIITVFFAVWFSIGAYLNLRNAFHHKDQRARISYRVFLGGVALITALMCILALSIPLAQPVTAVISFGVIFSLGMCLIVIGWVEW